MSMARTEAASRRVLVLKVLSIVCVLALWELFGRTKTGIIFPPFSSVCKAFYDMLISGVLYEAYAKTLFPLVVGLLLTATCGVGIGITMGLAPLVEWFLILIVVALQSAPMSAVIPLIIYIYGIGFTAKVLAVILLSSPIIILNSYKGIRNAQSSLVEMGTCYLANRRQLILKIIIPDASGMIAAGLRLGVGGGFVGIILAELLITPTGIGDLISYYQMMAKYDHLYAVILSFIILAVSAVNIIQSIEKNYWRPELKRR